MATYEYFVGTRGTTNCPPDSSPIIMEGELTSPCPPDPATWSECVEAGTQLGYTISSSSITIKCPWLFFLYSGVKKF
jgi:hypothetical protein